MQPHILIIVLLTCIFRSLHSLLTCIFRSPYAWNQTLFDYGGEPGPWPSVSSSFGQFDLAGFAKSASYWYRANWLSRVPPSDAGRPPLPVTHTTRISQVLDRC